MKDARDILARALDRLPWYRHFDLSPDARFPNENSDASLELILAVQDITAITFPYCEIDRLEFVQDLLDLIARHRARSAAI